MSKSKTRDKGFILEIGTEELPCRYLDSAMAQLENPQGGVRELFEKAKVKIGAIKAFGTPRRITLFIESISPVSEPQFISGPPKRIAYDKDGKPTIALKKFLSRYGMKEKDLKAGTSPDILGIIKKGNPTSKLLESIAPEIIRSLSFPKTMWWDDRDFKFARPIKWILCLCGSHSIKFKIAGIKSGDFTFGPFIENPRKIKVTSACDYFRKMKKSGIAYDPAQRKKMILEELKKYAKKEKAQLNFDKDLLDEVANLIEFPKVIPGKFNKDFLKLPPEVLLASMSKYQRVFGLKDKGGGLINRFLAVINNPKGNIKKITSHYEMILNARLKDSSFFMGEDSKQNFTERRGSELKQMFFHKELGSMYDKTERLVHLSEWMGEKLNFDAREKRITSNIAKYSKDDLTTWMVGEFPSLQGVMGKYYAKGDLLKEEALGIGEHYLPRFADDRLPESKFGSACAIADKIDSIVGFFGIGKSPKSSGDPYALRRQASGCIRIILEKQFRFSISDLIDKSIALYSAKLKLEPEILKNNIIEFFKDRFIGNVKEEFRYDLLDSVVNIDFDDMFDVYMRLRSLSGIFKGPQFECARVVVERTNNILKGTKRSELSGVKTELFLEELENKLWKQYNDFKGDIEKLIESRKYEEATIRYGKAFAEIIHKFFDKVLVNVEDSRVKKNRLAMMDRINSLYTKRIADLSKIVAGQR